MSYKINGVELSKFGATPIIPNSGIFAVEGILDLPQRVGNIERNWGTVIEPFVSEADIKHDGRKIVLNLIVSGESDTDLVSKIENLSDSCMNGEIELATPLGTKTVVLSGKVEISPNNFELFVIVKMNFVEQDVKFEALTKKPTSGATKYLLDGFDLIADFGIHFEDSKDLYSTPERIEIKTTDNYKVTRYRNASDIELKCTMIQPNITSAISSINQLWALLKLPGLRTYIDGWRVAHKVFCTNSVKVYFTSSTDEEVIARFTLKLRQVEYKHNENTILQKVSEGI